MSIYDETKYVWLDCDPGHDDAFAIILATHTPNMKLIGVSTIAGNQTIQKTTKNAMTVLNLLGFVHDEYQQEQEQNGQQEVNNNMNANGIQLLQGCSKPIMRPGVICEEIHGDSGLETFSKDKKHSFPPLPKHALDYLDGLNNSNQQHFTSKMYQTFKNHHKKVTLVATGPLTNIALLLLNYPDVVDYVDKLVLMGGAMGIGNTGPVAEFNIQVDPEAAHIVFESALKSIYMVPLEVTHTALVTHDIIASIRDMNTPFSHLMLELLLYFKSTYDKVFFMLDPPLHDPCAITFVIDPAAFEHRLMRVDVETRSHLSHGQTVCDTYGMSKLRKNVHVCVKMDVSRFWSLMLDALAKANENYMNKNKTVI